VQSALNQNVSYPVRRDDYPYLVPAARD